MKTEMNMNERTAKRDIVKMTRLFVNRTLPLSMNTIISASRLFRKWAKIGTKMFSVLRYRIAMQIPKINAENMDPKL